MLAQIAARLRARQGHANGADADENGGNGDVPGFEPGQGLVLDENCQVRFLSFLSSFSVSFMFFSDPISYPFIYPPWPHTISRHRSLLPSFVDVHFIISSLDNLTV